VRQLENGDRREQERALEPPREALDAGVPFRHVVQHPRHDPPALERGAIRLDRALEASAACDVCERSARHRLERQLFEGISGDRDGLPSRSQAAEVDLLLP
jgi:hypothetical protein